MQKYGTPEQDAMRRDLTINSLFYNINTKSVEDWTNRGIKDLKFGNIATPLSPRETIMEDPVHGLRAIRIGTRYRFTLVEQLKEAAASDEVKAAPSAKVSRERIGAEIDLMISGDQPVQAMTLLCDFNWFWYVFRLHPQCEPPSDRACVTYLESICNLIGVIGPSTFTDEQRRISFYAAMFLPLRTTTYKDERVEEIPVVNFIFRYSLKSKVSDAETVIKIHNAVEKFLPLLPHFGSSGCGVQLLAEDDLGTREYVDDLSATSKKSQLRVLMGFLLREIKDVWTVALLLCCSEDPLNKNLTLEDRTALFRKVQSAIIDDLCLDKVWDVKPLLRGTDIIKHLGLKSGGPVVSERKWKVFAWVLILQGLKRNAEIG
ncbi:tRNA nucleotidyltransferase cca2-like [Rosa rugosa]|uniref:tRNA nucleotidyltransferase cca2-like n=1 Tax=Rosa rugosa TaxID=74645 RepID=UPI002B40DD6C|nr:tRNA nucleotidyltransferase cca2-like [Rosa rugosa]